MKLELKTLALLWDLT
uniref:Uncharacterized protein n=1 Tax=Anguilla anguilla TaxID=7936 RepID=A0A0E9VUB4_ANGAN